MAILPVLPDDTWYVCYDGAGTVQCFKVGANLSAETGLSTVESFTDALSAYTRGFELGWVPRGVHKVSVETVEGLPNGIKFPNLSDDAFLKLVAGAKVYFSDLNYVPRGASCLSVNPLTGITTWSSDLNLQEGGVPFTLYFHYPV